MKFILLFHPILLLEGICVVMISPDTFGQQQKDSDGALRQIRGLQQEMESQTSVQRKMDLQLESARR